MIIIGGMEAQGIALECIKGNDAFLKGDVVFLDDRDGSLVNASAGGWIDACDIESYLVGDWNFMR